MEEEKLSEGLRELAQSYNAPPKADVDGMWDVIEARHFDTPTLHETVPDAPSMWSRTRTAAPWWSNGWLRAAAALVIGVGLGRVTLGTDTVASSSRNATPVAAVADASGEAAATTVMSDPATLRYIGQTVALLASFEADAPPLRGDSAIKSRARELLLSTRLLLDASRSNDPIVRSLLEDLELVLVQIVQMPPKRNASDVYLIKEAMDQRDVMPRLIAAVTNTTSVE